jgi:hypothetical protein
MMQKFLGVVLLAGIGIALVTGCHSAKKIQSVKKIQKAISALRKDTLKTAVDTTVSIQDLRADSMRVIGEAIGKLKQNRIDFRTFSAKMKVHYEGGDGKDYDFNATIHILKDSMIWVSINAVLGFEAFRVLITPDSVKVKNNLDRIIQFRSVSYLQDVTHIPLDFKTLQDLLIGNPVYLDSSKTVYYKNEQTGMSLVSVGELFRNYLTLNPDYTLKHSRLDDENVLRALTCDVAYGDYESRDTIRFSAYRKISVAEHSKLDIEFNYKQYNFNENLSFPFLIPRNYKRK